MDVAIKSDQLLVLEDFSGATLIGSAKEFYDSKHGGYFDKKDLAYTVAGGFISAGLITGTKAIIRKIKVKKYKYYRR